MTDEQRQQFIRAVRADNYAEWDLSDNVTVITDWQGNDVFNPYVVVSNKETSVQDVSDTLLEQDVFSVEYVSNDAKNECFFDLQGVEFHYWAEDVVEE